MRKRSAVASSRSERPRGGGAAPRHDRGRAWRSAAALTADRC